MKKNKNYNIIIIFMVIILIVLVGYLIFDFEYGDGNPLTSAKKKSFISDAKVFSEVLQSKVTSDTSGYYRDLCNSNTRELTIPLSELSSGIINFRNKSPFGGEYNLSTSFIKLEISNNCNYDYYVYMTDGTYSIGTPNNPILIKNININDVKK